MTWEMALCQRFGGTLPSAVTEVSSMIRIDHRDLVAPAAVVDIDAQRRSSRLVTDGSPGGYRTAFCLVRR